ncbi:MAG: L-threonylcarbamoyladenylate synthase [Alphaproteobacteria bacterium]
MNDEPTVANADPASIARAARLLREGALVAFPTETVYGLGGDATDDRAVAAIFAAKGRPRFNPLIVHVPDAAAAAAIGRMDPRAERLAATFWPGPLTLVMPRHAQAGVSLLAVAGLDSIALRVPDHPVAAALLRAAGRPIAAPSANPSGRISPTTAAHVVDGLGRRVAMVLDGGPCRVGLESTVLDLTGPEARLLRPGGVPRAALDAALGGPVADAAPDTGPVRSPGRLASHYAPSRPLRLAARSVGPDEALLAFGPAPPAGAVAMLNLSAAGDPTEAAANLFAHLRALDHAPARAIAVMPIPQDGLGEAINDRLRRAAAPRPADAAVDLPQ